MRNITEVQETEAVLLLPKEDRADGGRRRIAAIARQSGSSHLQEPGRSAFADNVEQ